MDEFLTNKHRNKIKILIPEVILSHWNTNVTPWAVA
jgi:hypothetical protein